MLFKIRVEVVVRSPEVKSLREGVDKAVGRRFALSREASHKTERNSEHIYEEKESNDLRHVELEREKKVERVTIPRQLKR